MLYIYTAIPGQPSSRRLAHTTHPSDQGVLLVLGHNSGRWGHVCSARQVSAAPPVLFQAVRTTAVNCTMRVELIGRFKPCMTKIYLHI